MFDYIIFENARRRRQVITAISVATQICKDADL